MTITKSYGIIQTSLIIIWQKQKVVGVFQQLLKQFPKKHVKDVGHIQSILRLVEIKRRKDIEDKESEEELYYESEKSV